jgi:hypothetical protein
VTPATGTTTRRWRPIGIAALIAVVIGLGGDSVAPAQAPVATHASTLPARLSDAAFWKLSASLSEPGGTFRSDNLVSNEHTFQYVLPALVRQTRPGGVYLGVAPDQNFTYIAAIRPAMAFIVDIRRGNLLELLMYKALFELSADRAEFISRLFSKARPPGLSPSSTVVDLFTAFDRVPTSEALYRENVRAIHRQLTAVHGFTLSEEDWDQLESIYFAFFWDGPSLRYSMGSGFGRWGGRGFNGFPSYEDLAMQTDWEGTFRSYLANDEYYQAIRSLEQRNLIVPVVGNFAGPKALRAVGRYVREHGATVSAFYVSNVEQYLFQDGLFPAFAENIATLPVDDHSTFIRSVSSRFGYLGLYLGPDGRASALDPIAAFVRDFHAGRIRTYYDVNSRSK